MQLVLLIVTLTCIYGESLGNNISLTNAIDGEYVNFTMTIDDEDKVDAGRYVAISFSTSMSNSYTMACYIMDNSFTGCREQFTGTGPRNSEISDGSNDIEHESFEWMGTDDITFEFRRKLDTGDVYDDVLEKGQTYDVIVAWGEFSSNTL